MLARTNLVLRQRRAVSGKPARFIGVPSLFANRTLVVARQDIREGLKIAPRGAFGVVTHVFARGLGYEVRFSEPERVTLCASANDLDLA